MLTAVGSAQTMSLSKIDEALYRKVGEKTADNQSKVVEKLTSIILILIDIIIAGKV